MEQEDLEKLIELSKEGFKCPHERCSEYENWNECYNHAHVLCPLFEVYTLNHINLFKDKDS